MGKKGKGKKGASTTDLKNDPNIVLATGDFTLPNGDTYSGEYCAHRLGVIWRQGHGIYTTHDGQIYEGEWADDKLIDNSELVINYPSGAEFHGRLIKNKYNGPGVYTLTNKLDISCQFANNQPQGDIALIDCNGKLWRGEAQKDQALLIPENIFYLILPEDRGKGVSRTLEYEIGSSCLGEEEEPNYPDEYWRDLIFAKSNMTDADIDFTDCEWYKRYNKFKRRKAEIERKLANNIGLEEEDSDWLDRFKQYKDQCRNREAEKALVRKKSSEAAFDLIKGFRSPEFLESCPEVKVFNEVKARKDGDEISAESSSDQSYGDVVSQSKFERSRLRSKVLVKKQVTSALSTVRHNLSDILPISTKIEAARQMDVMEEMFLQCTDVDPRGVVRTQLVQFDGSNRASRPVNEPEFPFKPGEMPVRRLKHATVQHLHFTKEREQLALQMRVQKILERKQADEDQVLLFSQAKQMVGEMEALKRYEEGAELEEIKTGLLTVNEEPKTPDTTIKSSFTNAMSAPDVAEDQQARVLRYINERVEQWQNEDDAKKKSRAEKMIVSPPMLHLHSVGVHTDSLPNIPKEFFIGITAGRPHRAPSMN